MFVETFDPRDGLDLCVYFHRITFTYHCLLGPALSAGIEFWAQTISKKMVFYGAREKNGLLH